MLVLAWIFSSSALGGWLSRNGFNHRSRWDLFLPLTYVLVHVAFAMKLCNLR